MSKNEKRITLWHITIHKEDTDINKKCLFDSEYLTRYLQKTFDSTSEIYFIKHEAEEEDKEEHIHLMIKFLYNRGRTFSRMKQLFPKSHIEEIFSEWVNNVLYLTHESIDAKKQGKKIYDRKLVVNVFDKDIEKYYNSASIETFDIDKIEDYIIKDNMRSIVQYGRRFGYSVVYQKWHIIKEIIKELETEQWNKQEKEFTEEHKEQVQSKEEGFKQFRDGGALGNEDFN